MADSYCTIFLTICMTRGEWVSLTGGFGGAFAAVLVAILFEIWLRSRKESATLRLYKKLLTEIRKEYAEWPKIRGNEEYWKFVTGDRAKKMTILLRQFRSANDWFIDRAPIEKFEIWIEANKIRDALRNTENLYGTEDVWRTPLYQVNFGQPDLANKLGYVEERLREAMDDVLKLL